MQDLFGDMACPKCGKAEGAKIRTSRKVTKNYIEYYLRCNHCDKKLKAAYSI